VTACIAAAFRAATIRERDDAGENTILVAAMLPCGADGILRGVVNAAIWRIS